MESTKLTLLFLISVKLLFGFSTQDFQNITSKGYTFELIPKVSVLSPFYNGNLTTIDQETQRLVNFSEVHALSLLGEHNKESMRMKLILSDIMYVVPLRIGNLKLNLALDTGSSLTWTQCISCNPCFPQKGQKYDPTKSHTYKALSPDHPFCDHRGGKKEYCPYYTKYVKGRTEGFFGRDKFTFESQTTELNVIFGCSLRTYGDPFGGHDEIDGVLGMGRGPESFAIQLSYQTKQPNKFSYCLPQIGSSSPSTIRFGSDIVLKGKKQETPLVRTEESYFLRLIDISIQGKRLNLRKDWFKLKSNGHGGCMIDSGTVAMHLFRPAFEIVKAKLIVYFKRFNITQIKGRVAPFHLCFQSRSSFHQYPYMNLHFEGGANFHLPYTNLFVFPKGRFCFTMVPSDLFTIIGSLQQAEHQIVYDVRNEKLIFSNAKCDNM